MAIAALAISVIALLLSGASVWYARTVTHIEKRRHHVEQTPSLIVNPGYDFEDTENQHLAPVDITSTTSFALRDVVISAVLDRPDKNAILNVDAESRHIDAIAQGETVTIQVLLAYAGGRTSTGVLRFHVHNKPGDEWILEYELEFPHSPTATYL